MNSLPALQSIGAELSDPRRLQALEQISEHSRRGAPDECPVEIVDVGAKRHPEYLQRALSETRAQLADGRLEHLFDLARRERPLQARSDQSDEWIDGVVRDRGLRRRERPDDIDGVRVEADLLLRLAQRRPPQVGLVVVLATARERELAGVTAQPGGASREYDVDVVAADEQR